MGNILKSENKILIDNYIFQYNKNQFNNIPNDETLNFKTNAFFSNIIDCVNGLELEINHKIIQEIFYNPNYYFHGTSVCNALSLFLNGIQNVYFKKNNATIQSVIGDDMFFLTDSFQKTLFYGDCVLVYETNFKKIAYIKPSESKIELENQFNKLTQISDLDVICVEGFYNRYGLQNTEKKYKNVLNLFSEYAVKNLKSLNLKYIIRIANAYPEKILSGQTKVLDIKSNSIQNVFLMDFKEQMESFNTEAVYIPCNFSEYCYYANLNGKEIWNEITNSFNPILKSTEFYNLRIYTDLDLIKDEFIIVANLFDSKRTVFPKAFIDGSEFFIRTNKEKKYSNNGNGSVIGSYISVPEKMFNIEILYVICNLKSFA